MVSFKISEAERKDLIIAWVVLSVAFGIVFIRSAKNFDPINIVIMMIVSFLTVGFGFAAHEMAHKFAANGYGFFAEFRRNDMMLAICFFLAVFFGAIFAAPGATVIYAMGLTREQNGKISAAGPVVNLFLCAPFGIITVISYLLLGKENPVSLLGMLGFSINAMFATFNMIPIGPLDGKKVLAWSHKWYAIIGVIAVSCLIISLVVGIPI